MHRMGAVLMTAQEFESYSENTVEDIQEKIRAEI
jgi:hypothetical protein